MPSQDERTDAQGASPTDGSASPGPSAVAAAFATVAAAHEEAEDAVVAAVRAMRTDAGG